MLRQHPAQNAVAQLELMKDDSGDVEANERHDQPANGGVHASQLVGDGACVRIEGRQAELVEDAVASCPRQRNSHTDYRRQEGVKVQVGRLGERTDEAAIGRRQRLTIETLDAIYAQAKERNIPVGQVIEEAMQARAKLGDA